MRMSTNIKTLLNSASRLLTARRTSSRLHIHTTNIFFATDIHGSNSCFKQFLNIPKFLKTTKNIDIHVLILGGDVTGKQPIFLEMKGKDKAAAYRADMSKTLLAQLESSDAIATFETLAADTGSYTYRCTPEEHAQLRCDVENNGGALWSPLFSSLKEARMREWVKLADDRMRDSGVQIFFNAGNDDAIEIDAIIDKSASMVRPEGKCIVINEQLTMISTGFANITPFCCPRDVSEDELARKIDLMASQIPDTRSCIFNLHCPPFNTNLDKGPALDKDLRPGMSAFGKDEAHVGSKAVRGAIEKYQPLLALHGHIHESRGVHQIGRTVCINPGSEYESGLLRGALIKLAQDSIQSYQFIGS